MRASLVAAVLLLSMSGCSDAHTDDPESSAPSAALRVEWDQSPGRGGAMYFEGAVPDFELTSADGEKLPPDQQGDQAWSWESLPVGSYVLRAGQRPCDGNCGMLDGLTDRCSKKLDLDGVTRVVVRLVVQRPCVIRVGD